MKALSNLALTLILFGLFMVPVIAIHRMVSFETVPNKGVVAGARTIDSSDLNIIPNTSDFDKYASFAPHSFENGVYKDNVTVTSFQRQQATYRGLYTLYNVSKDPIKLTIVGDIAVPTDATFDRIVLGFGNNTFGEKLSADLKKGTSLIPMDVPLEGVNVGDKILIGDELVSVLRITPTHLVTMPLQNTHKAGEKMYPQSVVLTPGEIVFPESGVYVLEAGEKVLVNLEVKGSARLLQQDQKVTVPLEIRAQRLDS